MEGVGAGGRWDGEGRGWVGETGEGEVVRWRLGRTVWRLCGVGSAGGCIQAGREVSGAEYLHGRAVRSRSNCIRIGT